MTEQEIRNLQPGPDMDILLEVELFGKVRGGVGRLGLVGNGRYYSYPRHLSRTWEGMGLVLEKVKTLHEDVFIEIDYEKGRWACYIWFGVIKKAEAFASEAPHAVAKAALLALRGGEQG
ncbi:hypothetical protein [Paenibacillus ehimensis]|uniref:hypothetical protein n=1 Tax=Paenibacillus ehimensis TaxID=79264 RepID=UPI00047110BA|nr:hypothetical protein [Paenibacillus ehimensis]